MNPKSGSLHICPVPWLGLSIDGTCRLCTTIISLTLIRNSIYTRLWSSCAFPTKIYSFLALQITLIIQAAIQRSSSLSCLSHFPSSESRKFLNEMVSISSTRIDHDESNHSILARIQFLKDEWFPQWHISSQMGYKSSLWKILFRLLLIGRQSIAALHDFPPDQSSPRPCSKLLDFRHNHIGSSMLVHGSIRSNPNFIRNKILIILYILNIISKRFSKLK